MKQAVGIFLKNLVIILKIKKDFFKWNKNLLSTNFLKFFLLIFSSFRFYVGFFTLFLKRLSLSCRDWNFRKFLGIQYQIVRKEYFKVLAEGKFEGLEVNFWCDQQNKKSLIEILEYF